MYKISRYDKTKSSFLFYYVFYLGAYNDMHFTIQ